MTKQQNPSKFMSVYIDDSNNDKDLPMTYSINIKTLSTSKRPLTCCITTTKPHLSKQREINQLNYIKPSTKIEKSHDFCLKSSENNHQSSIHLPITYSTSIHIPCHPSTITIRPPIILPSQSSHHHYHYYHHHHHHHRQSPSTTLKHKISPRPISIDSNQPTITSTTTTNTSPKSLSPSKKSNKNILSSNSLNQKSTPNHPLPSYSTLVWNWFHHIPTKIQTHQIDNQSDYSEVYRHELPSKRSLLTKFLTSSIEKQSKSKHHRTCFNRKRLESSSSLPNKFINYNE